MKKSQILKLVRDNFVDVQSHGHAVTFVCWALDYVYATTLDGDDRPNIRELKHWIHELLEHYATLETWVHAKHRATYEDMVGIIAPGSPIANRVYGARAISADNFRQLRILWLDWMIVYWEEKGD